MMTHDMPEAVTEKQRYPERIKESAQREVEIKKAYKKVNRD